MANARGMGVIMRRVAVALAVTTTLTAAIGQVASAADLRPVFKAPPPVATAWSWSGLYVGAHVGAGWGTKEQTILVVDTPGRPFLSDGTQTINGFLGGVQLGYNWQPAD